MIDLLLKIGLSNLCIALLLAGAAWAVQARGQRPRLAHLLWLLVLVKLVTPPLVTLPMLAIPGEQLAAHLPMTSAAPELLPAAAPSGELAPPSGAPQGSTQASSSAWLDGSKLALVLAWLLGSLLVLLWSSMRILRFNRLLGQASSPAPTELQAVADELGATLGLASIPRVMVTEAQLSPLLWSTASGVRIYLPSALLERIDTEEVRWILAHELGHVRRKDHLVRWLEWLACVAFWWNPLAWLARRNLRLNEEVCCDALVLSSFQPHPHRYANSLLQVLEFLSTPALRPPAVASQINSGGELERRIKMIISKRSLVQTPRWLSACVLVCSLGLLPLGIAYAQDPDYEAVSERLIRAVQAGELSAAQAEAMIGSLAREHFAERLRDAKHATHQRKGKGDLVEHYERQGVDLKTLGRVKQALKGSGIQPEQMKGVLGVVLRLMQSADSQAERSGMDERIRAYLESLKLSAEQIKTIHGLARRLHKLADGADQAREVPATIEQAERTKKRLIEAVKAGELTKRQAAEKLKALDKWQRQHATERNSQLKRKPKLPARTGEEDPNAELTRRTKERLIEAIKAGKLSKEQAVKKLKALEQKLEAVEQKRRKEAGRNSQEQRLPRYTAQPGEVDPYTAAMLEYRRSASPAYDSRLEPPEEIIEEPIEELLPEPGQVRHPRRRVDESMQSYYRLRETAPREDEPGEEPIDEPIEGILEETLPEPEPRRRPGRSDQLRRQMDESMKRYLELREEAPWTEELIEETLPEPAPRPTPGGSDQLRRQMDESVKRYLELRKQAPRDEERIDEPIESIIEETLPEPRPRSLRSPSEPAQQRLDESMRRYAAFRRGAVAGGWPEAELLEEPVEELIEEPEEPTLTEPEERLAPERSGEARRRLENKLGRFLELRKRPGVER